MNTITAYGKEYPMRMTMGAMRRFAAMTGTDVSRMGSDLSLMAVLMYCCVASACNADNVPFSLDVEKFTDGVELDAVAGFAAMLEGGTKKRHRSSLRERRKGTGRILSCPYRRAGGTRAGKHGDEPGRL